MIFKFSITFISSIFLFMISLCMFILGFQHLMINKIVLVEWSILSLNGSNVIMTMLFDWMSLMFIGLVMYISSMVIYYSGQYMEGDYNINRFIMLVLLFVLSMLFLIISPNIISIIVGWDGLGLVSYCLVIYYQNVRSYGAGMLTALSNRIGDVFILLSVAWMLNYGSWNYIHYLWLICDYDMMLITSLIIIAAMTKSAQIPFSAWLPAAMAAPTPVSALVHSSTLVTAGVYLLIRFNEMIIVSFMGKLLLLSSGLTMFMAGVGANFEYDLKSIIALSTLSQLGLMMMTLSMGMSILSFFHLMTHAMFKSLLFLCAGAIIHGMGDVQDIRYMGGLINNMPLTISCLCISNFALCGMPFLAGFYSKDLILEMLGMSFLNMLGIFLLWISTGMTMCYVFRLNYYLVGKNYYGSSMSMISDEDGWIMFTGMLGLLMLSICGGSILSWMIFSSINIIILPYYLKMIAVIIILFGIWLGYNIMSFSLSKKALFLGKNYLLFSMLGSMWFMPNISSSIMIELPLWVGGAYGKLIDTGWNEYLGGQGMYKYSKSGSSKIQIVHFNNFNIYFMFFFIMFIMMILFFN
uniref:NADH-ubiquinone oxidoreductase chain 5 n=1 Tax=Neoasterolepisma foreli TaxID=2779710 RepID=A0A7L9R532_9INSE|nr:NADH dehydrogenase subunit 5 [Neoasterolepisma foreli]QOL10508.1 NADH dehydrogenase subunit 5 [Neoasterolepisma foreli]